MAEQEEKSASFPWLPLLTLVGIGSGVIFFFPQLVSSRPGGGDPRLAEDTFDEQTVDARLWQDPLGVAIQSQQKEGQGSSIHAVEQFQKLFIGKCIPEAGVSSSLEDAEAKLRQVAVVGVMIPGGPYVEDIERRLRSRRAVIESLGSEQYEPEKDHEIGYFCVAWRSLQANVGDCVSRLESDRSKGQIANVSSFDGRCPANIGACPARKEVPATATGRPSLDTIPLLVPYEWFEPATSKKAMPYQHVLVLWLVDDAFRDGPLARLADVISWFKLDFYDISGSKNSLALPPFKILGPDNSGTLHQMVLEAEQNLWSNETRDYLAATHIYSSQAAAAERQLLSGIPDTNDVATCKEFIEQKVKGRELANDFRFDRTILLDDQIVATLQTELARRGVGKDDDVAIISEEDTYYARALSTTFWRARSGHVHRYKYLRGIDGKLPGDNKSDSETKNSQESNKETSSSTRPTEQTEGLNQADDIRRLAETLRDLNLRLQSDGRKGLMAVGLLGSDVYDKLELLRAFRPALPETTFFTNHLDARFAHPDEWKETHNLIVVSENNLSAHVRHDRPQEVAPFRDSGQTGLFEATLEAVGQLDPESAKPKEPFIFEIGRNQTVQLNDKDVFADTISRTAWPLTCMLGFVGLLGLCLAPRAAFASSKGKMPAARWWRYLGVPVCAILTVLCVFNFYFLQNGDNNGEHFSWLNGTSAWPSIALILFAGFLSIYFIVKVRCDLRQNARKLEDEFGLPGPDAIKRPRLGTLDFLRLVPLAAVRIFIPTGAAVIDEKVDITALWQRYLIYGLFWRRLLRALTMSVFYLLALGVLVVLIGGYPRSPIRGFFPFPVLIGAVISLFVLLTFLVIDGIALHESFLNQLAERETRWPSQTFKNFGYAVTPDGPYSESDLADYWDILLIGRRTEVIGNLIYYPFIVLSVLILSRLPYFANWTWTPGLIVALTIHFLLAMYAAWRLPRAAREYREIILERMQRRRRQNLTDPKEKSGALDAVIEDVQSMHQGAFAYLWEQPAVRALLFPSSGLGLTTLLQWLPH